MEFCFQRSIRFQFFQHKRNQNLNKYTITRIILENLYSNSPFGKNLEINGIGILGTKIA